MRKLLTVAGVTLLLLLVGMRLASDPGYFRVISGIPHLPVVDPNSIVLPSAGMLVYSSSDNRPMVYTGSSWETLCSSNVSGAAAASFGVQEGIPYLSALTADPSGPVEPGAVYFSRSEGSMKVHNGASWRKLSQLKGSSSINQSNGFSTSSSLQLSRLPVLANNPAPIGLSAGAVYINATTKTIRFYNGTTWQEVSCGPVVATEVLSGVTNTKAVSGAVITDDGGTPILLQGVVWSAHPNTLPDTTLSTKTRFKISGPLALPASLPSTLTNLTASTTYYVRAYAVNSAGISYGEVRTFTTAIASVPQIITLKETELTPISARTGGDIPSTGGATVWERGLIWSTTRDPLQDTVKLIVDPAATKTRDGSGPGLFPTRLTNLVQNTTYYVRAYARNDIGPAYGNLVVFNTLPATPPVLSSPTINIYAITDTSAKSEVTILNNGGAEVLERGIAWSKIKLEPWAYEDDNIVHRPSAPFPDNKPDIGTFAGALGPLEPGTLYYVRPYARNREGIRYGAETSLRTTSLPTLRTLPATSITGFTAVSGGEVMSTGVSPVTQRGIVWSTNPAFDPASVPANQKILHLVPSHLSGVGLYNSNLSNLLPNTTYWVRAFATNGLGTAYGDTIRLTTATLPAVTTLPEVGQIASTTATSGGNVTTDGGQWVFARGVVWSTSPEPTLATGKAVPGGGGTGAYVSNITDLMANTTYYVRAYASNSVGTVYGQDVSFTTPAPVPATITTWNVTDIGANSAVARGYISQHGGDTITWRGICWNTTGMPTVNDFYVQSPVSGLGTGHYNVDVTGLTPNQTYYVRAFAETSAGIVYGNQLVFKTFTTPAVVTLPVVTVASSSATAGGRVVSDGGTPVFNSGLVWGTSRTLLDLQNKIGNTSGGAGIGDFIQKMSGLLGNTKYYFRAYATNKAGTSYGAVDSLMTGAPVAPTLVTRPVSEITGTTAVSGGNVTDHGGALLRRTGLVWSTSSGFDPAEVPAANRTLQTDKGSFSSTMTNLQLGQTYYVRAYAENEAGLITYGQEVTFSTLNLATVVTNPLVDHITSTTAVGGGTISSNGGTHVSQNGVVWATHNNPTLADKVSTPVGSGVGSFTAQLNDLLGNTTYWARAYATNRAGTAYGLPIVSFTTPAPVAPTLTTTVPKVSSPTSATGGGDITSHGGALVTTRGLVWSTTASFVPDTVTAPRRTAQTGYFTGAFTNEMTGLVAGQTYYVRAYAENEAGLITYGPEVSFIMPNLPSLSTKTVTLIGNKTATGGGIVNSNGGSPIISSGVIWSTDVDFVPSLTAHNKTVEQFSGSFSSKMTGLEPQTTYYVWAYATNLMGTSFGQQVSFTTNMAGMATITTTAPKDITSTSATGGGVISDDGGLQVSTRGVLWSLIKDFDPNTDTVIDSTVQSGSSIGSFASNITGLQRGLTYYVRAYVDNGMGRAYGDALPFTTQDLPKVRTLAISDTTAFSALGAGEITDDGKATLMGHGLVWSTSSGPHTGLATKTIHSGGIIGPFTSTLTKLKPITTYYVRAYAINTVGQAYGEEISFTTPAAVPTLTTAMVFPTSENSAEGGGNITDDGGAAITQRGLVWSIDPNFDPDTVTVNRTDDGSGTGTFTSILKNLEGRITYYIKAYAINKAGTGYGEIVPFSMFATSPELITNPTFTGITGNTATGGGEVIRDGGSPVHTWGLVWSETDFNPIISKDPHTTIKDASIMSFMSSFTSQMTGLKPNTKYYVRAYAINGEGTAYGLTETVETATRPTLTATGPVLELRPTTANIQGEVTDDGRMPLTARGFIWSIYDDPTTATAANKIEEKITSGNGLGVFSGKLTGLTPEKEYYVWAYATNMVGTRYASSLKIKTLPVMAPTVVTSATTAVTGTSADAGGEVTDDGGDPVTERGLVWSTNKDVQLAQPGSNYVVSGAGTGAFTAVMSGMQPKTKYYYKAFASNKLKGTGYGQVDSLTTSAMAPSLSDVTTANPQPTTVQASATVTKDGGEPVTAHGFVWNTTGVTPDLAVHDTLQILGAGPVIADTLKSLEPGTTYYIWAWATNSVGTGFSSNAISFTPEAVPTLTTTKPTHDAVTNSGLSGGNITKDGGKPVTARGIVWSTTDRNPTVALPLPTNKTEDKFTTGNGIGSFSHSIPNLVPGETYYIRAYATNSVGTGYGQLDSLKAPAITPTLSAVTLSNMTTTGVDAAATVVDNGGAAITAKGFVWNMTGNPTTADQVVNSTATDSTLSASLSGMTEGPVYYLRAYATNSEGLTGYGPVETFKVCPPTLTVYHVEGENGAPASKKVDYEVISSSISGEARCWITRNLGADRQATSATDNSDDAAGWYWEYNNKQGYLATGARPGWVTNMAATTWDPANDPCRLLLGAGWSLPTDTEWTNADASQNWKNYTEAKASVLNLHAGGYATSATTGVTNRGSVGYYWSRNINGRSNGLALEISSGNSFVQEHTRYAGFTVRCLQATSVATTPAVSKVVISNMQASTADVSAVVMYNNGDAVTDRGFVWNTTGQSPNLATDKVIKADPQTGIGPISGTMTGLQEGTSYYVWAYATNGQGTAFGTVTSFVLCTPVTVVHVAGHNGAPVTKSVTYQTVSSNISGQSACWLTQNLGASQQASSATDNTDASAGWYWQFNRSQGYEITGTTRTPNTAWTSSINEGSDWIPANDPCSLLLGSGWRLPTATEWTNADAAPQNWTKMSDTYASVLKLHGPGDLNTGGGLEYRGWGFYWSSTQASTTNGSYLRIGAGESGLSSLAKAYGFSVRCLQQTSLKTKPSVSKVTVSNMQATTADLAAGVSPDGGDPVTDRGFVWNTTGAAPNLTTDNVIKANPQTGMGPISGTMTGLQEGPTYYVWAYATNNIDTAFGPVESFQLCPQVTVMHVAGHNGAPVDKTVTYQAVNSNISGQSACWITQNLGADKQADALADKADAAAGWYWQFNRIQGYQIDGTTRMPNTTWNATAYTETSDWLLANDPCNLLLGGGWRLPTNTEWTNADGAPQNWANATDTWNSVLKLHLAGYLSDVHGGITERGVSNHIWSSTSSSATHAFELAPGLGGPRTINKTFGFSVRCLKVTSTKTAPSVSTVTATNVTTTTADVVAAVTPDGGAPVEDRGFAWNTTGTLPAVGDGKSTFVEATPKTGVGRFNTTLTGLPAGENVYVWAYAENAIDLAFGPVELICSPTLKVYHMAGVNGAPVSKEVTYGVVSSKLSGETKCWITQNLGADRQATLATGGATDGSEASAGWYWQFNRSQGYKHDGTTRTPNTWITSINEATNGWLPENEPCRLLLGEGWRLPTAGEWLNALNTQAWKNYNDTYNSVLKLHASGYLSLGGGLAKRGDSAPGGYFWSSTSVSNDKARRFATGATLAVINDAIAEKHYGFSARCLRDAVAPAAPAVSRPIIGSMTTSTADASAAVMNDGGAPVTDRGLVWNTTGQAPNLLTDNVIKPSVLTGTGKLSGTISGITEGPSYYVWAYATNKAGTSFSPVESFMLCPQVVTHHVQGHNGAPETKAVTYGTVSTNITGQPQCWITQNLGATKQAASATDVDAAATGWFWQFNRSQGYTLSGATRMPNMTWNAVSEDINWPKANDPCQLLLGGSWRLPTATEWTAADASQNWTKADDAYKSVLKLHMAGILNTAGSLISQGTSGLFWTSDQTNLTTAKSFDIGTSAANSATTWDKRNGHSVRCVRDAAVKTAPAVSAPTASNVQQTSMNVSAVVMHDGGDKMDGWGFAWNTTGVKPVEGDGTSTFVPASQVNGTIFSATLTGLAGGPNYYVWAYAKNSVTTTLGPREMVCAPTLTAYHTEGLNGAPETKEVSYGVVSTRLSGESKCWITQNLGATKQAASATDADAASTGWFWQFNRSQGYTLNGSARVPNTTWTAVNEFSDWTRPNDPCQLLLGGGWRLPTSSEWENADATRNWGNYTHAWDSELKLHAAGFLNTNGAIASRGSIGYFWSSNQWNNTVGRSFDVTATTSVVSTSWDKRNGFTLRCLLGEATKSLPTVTKPTIATTQGASTADVTAAVLTEGGAGITDRGFVWNTTGEAPDFSKGNVTKVQAAQLTGTGPMNTTLTGLTEGPTYYVWAYAINSVGTAFSSVETLKYCPPTITVVHEAGASGAPVSKTVTYNVVNSKLSGESRCWIAQNLGASQPATAATDNIEASAGWYYQFGILQGYEYTTTRTPNTTWQGTVTNGDWEATNDPCVQLLGGGWRLPTATEWTNADATPNWTKAADAYSSELKLHMGGYIGYSQYSNPQYLLLGRGTEGLYWSSTSNNGTGTTGTTGYALYMTGAASSVVNNRNKRDGGTVRCLRDNIIKTLPAVGNVVITNLDATASEGTARVVHNGADVIQARGLVWNTTGTTPDINGAEKNNLLLVAVGSGTGVFTRSVSELTQEPVYYVWAYATNSKGTSYSPLPMRYCPPFTVQHYALSNVAPVDKTVTYRPVSTSISGNNRCWLNKNLGADREATSAADVSPEAAGWYWQFKQSQGYAHDGTGRTPATAWPASAGIGTWTSDKDPCNLLLGGGWRLPTHTEWINADAAQNWNNYTDTYNSILKLHAGGRLNTGGVLEERGVKGYYWNGTGSSNNGNWGDGGGTMEISSTSSAYSDGTTNHPRNAHAVRCVLDEVVKSKPTISNVSISDINATTGQAKGTVTVFTDGKAGITARGLIWNTTGVAPTSVPAQEVTVDASKTTGIFTNTLTGLGDGPIYYVWAYATNSEGTTFSAQPAGFRVCPEITVTHTKGTVAPATKQVTYKMVSSNATGAYKCWIAQNLGADHQATSATDASEAAAGWYWPFGKTQGFSHDGASRTPTQAEVTWVTGGKPGPWTNTTDPCGLLLGAGWRIPLGTELSTVSSSQKWANYSDAWNSPLKLHAAGQIEASSGNLINRGVAGNYWSRDHTYGEWHVGYGLMFTSSTFGYSYQAGATGNSLRCIKD